MVHATLVLVTVLALAATGSAIWAAVSLASPPAGASGETREHRDGAAAVARFYAALTEGGQTERTVDQADAVTPGFTVHGPDFPDAVGLAALDRVLRERRVACPACVASVDSLAVDGDVASVVVTGRTDRNSSVLGLPVDGDQIAWTAHDRLRIEDGRIAEYWSGGAAVAVPNPLAGDLLLTLPPTGFAQVGLTHLSLQPGANTVQAFTTVARHLVVESGVLTVGTGRVPRTEDGRTPIPVGDLDVVGPGEHATIPTNVRLDLRNDGTAPDNAWVIAIRMYVENVNTDPAWLTIEMGAGDRSAGVGLRVVATTIVRGLPGSHRTLAIAHVTLGPEATIGPHAVGGTELLSIGAGELSVTADGGGARIVRRQESEMRTHPDDDRSGEAWRVSAVLTALDTVVLTGGRVAAASNTGSEPVNLIVLVIAPTIPNRTAP